MKHEKELIAKLIKQGYSNAEIQYMINNKKKRGDFEYAHSEIKNIKTKIHTEAYSSFNPPKVVAYEDDPNDKDGREIRTRRMSKSVKDSRNRIFGRKATKTGYVDKKDPSNSEEDEQFGSVKESLIQYIKQIRERCWDGFEPVPGKKPYSKGSCRRKKKLKEAKDDFLSTFGTHKDKVKPKKIKHDFSKDPKDLDAFSASASELAPELANTKTGKDIVALNRQKKLIDRLRKKGWSDQRIGDNLINTAKPPTRTGRGRGRTSKRNKEAIANVHAPKGFKRVELPATQIKPDDDPKYYFRVKK